MIIYTKKELKGMSTERLIVILVIISSYCTKSSKQTEDKILKELHIRKVIDYDLIKSEYEKTGLWFNK